MHASCQKSTALHSVRFAELSTMQQRCGVVWGRAILAATTNKNNDRARAYHSTRQTVNRCNIPQHSSP
jgi:hypothetical protein